MFSRLTILLLTATSVAKICSAQTDATSLQAALKDKQMWLRSYSADPIVAYDWSNGSLLVKPVKLHGLTAFITHSVSEKRGKLLFEGDRAILIRDVKDNKFMMDGKAPMKLEIDLHGADPSTVIPNVQNALFFPDVQIAVKDRPASVAGLLPF